MKTAKIVLGYLISLYIRFKGNRWYMATAIRKAKRLHKKTGKRYRVFFLDNRYQALTRDDLQRSKHANQMGWNVNSTAMDQFAFFDTNVYILLDDRSDWSSIRQFFSSLSNSDNQ